MPKQIVLITDKLDSTEPLKLGPYDPELFPDGSVVKEMIDDDDDEEIAEIPVKVAEKWALKIMEFLAHHQKNPMEEIAKPIKSNKLKDNVKDPFDAALLEPLTKDELCELVLAANYMGIKHMVDLVCCAIASEIKNKTPDEIRQMFNMPPPATKAASNPQASD